MAKFVFCTFFEKFGIIILIMDITKRKKIYIIEDDANILYGLQAKFNIEGYQVRVNQGSDELEIINELISFTPDYIILDLILPTVDGFILLSKIKSNNILANSLVFIFTNLSDNDTMTRAKNIGVNYFFLKNSFNLDEFVETFKKVNQNRQKVNL